MKAIKQHLKVLALFLSVLMLFQGCTVYRSANVSLEEAVRSKAKVKVLTDDNRTLKFIAIDNDNGRYYGINKDKGIIVQSSLHEDNISKIQLKNKELSSMLSIGLGLVFFLGIGAIIAFSSDSPPGWP
jgi:hypothetical protein